MDFSPKNMRARFRDLTAKSEAAHAKLDPLRDELAELVQGDTKLSVKAARAREDAVRALIIKGNDALYPIEQERALISRALNGKTGEPEEAEPAAE